MTQYLVYRHGANAANQPSELKRPVVIVEAESADAACETVAMASGTAYATTALRLARGVHAYVNQHFTAIAVSRAPRQDVARVEREEAES